MKRYKTLAVLIISIAVAAVLLGGIARVTHAQGSDSSGSEVLAKLNEVLNNQKTIMQEIAGIREDLRIIKIRITQSQ